MVEAQEQAKQLDSVTDNVAEKEVDASKAQEAMNALASSGKQAQEAAAAQQVTVSKQDVDLIVSELEVSEEVAIKTLREVASEVNSNETLVVAALRKLVTT